jgi:hypothetical protein
MSKLKLKIAHQVPGRIRMKLGGAKGDVAALEEIKATFSAIPGIEDVTINPTTGSVVLRYDVDRHDAFHGGLHHHCPDCAPTGRRPPKGEIDELADKIADEAEYLAENSETARMLVDLFKRVDREIKTSTGNTLDLKVALAAGVVAFTVLEIGATAATPIWLTFAIFGLNHLVELRHVDARAAEPKASDKPGAAPAGSGAPATVEPVAVSA